MTDHQTHLKAHLNVFPEGARFLTTYRPETLREFIKRRARLLWGCLTLNPDDDFHYEWHRPFGCQVAQTEVVLPGHPDYDKADATAAGIYRVLLGKSPWLSLVEGSNFPDGIGDTGA